MGDRAVITWTTDEDIQNSNDIGIYVHWNGDRKSIEAFLKYCELKKYRTPDTDVYGYAYFVSVVANYFGNGLSVGIGRCNQLDCDNFDNGVYICKGWKIIGRKYHDNNLGFFKNENMMSLLSDIDDCQPVEHRIFFPCDEEFLITLNTTVNEFEKQQKSILKAIDNDNDTIDYISDFRLNRF